MARVDIKVVLLGQESTGIVCYESITYHMYLMKSINVDLLNFAYILDSLMVLYFSFREDDLDRALCERGF